MKSKQYATKQPMGMEKIKGDIKINTWVQVKMETTIQNLQNAAKAVL